MVEDGKKDRKLETGDLNHWPMAGWPRQGLCRRPPASPHPPKHLALRKSNQKPETGGLKLNFALRKVGGAVRTWVTLLVQNMGNTFWL